MRLYRDLQRLPGLPAELARDRPHVKRRHANVLRPILSEDVGDSRVEFGGSDSGTVTARISQEVCP